MGYKEQQLTEEAGSALAVLLNSLGVRKAYRYDKIALAVGGDAAYGGEPRFIALEFCQDASDPLGCWIVKENRSTG